jgi:hypothetical protein
MGVRPSQGFDLQSTIYENAHREPRRELLLRLMLGRTGILQDVNSSAIEVGTDRLSDFFISQNEFFLRPLDMCHFQLHAYAQ